MAADRHEEALKRFAEGTFIPAVPLALDAARRLDWAAQRRLVRYYLEAGAGGAAVAVHTTQFRIRDPQIALLEPVLRAAAEEIECFEAETGQPVVRVAGACGPTGQAVREAELARNCGYDAALLSPGGLGGLTEEALLERTRDVARILPVIGFYLQPSVGGRRLSYDYWRRLCEIENVIGVKCASFDRYSTVDVVRAAAFSTRNITLYTGNDDNIVIDLLTPYRFTVDGSTVTKRFQGGLLGHWAVCTRAAAKIFNELKQATQILPGHLRLAAEITDFNAAVFDARNGFRGCIPGVHEVLRRQGLLEGTWCLDPEETLSAGQAEEIDRVMEMYPHLCEPCFTAESRSP
ncbi:MAG: dihydrodipicolinate synthase family protein [Oscillospiraceae bacterium]|jgi:dihydrodipicolinate synthase/N-acetylneuraminate lyase|nr:dihydrodipicolinate synthase family protein [Oscillospiraceae bacterium]